MTFNISKKDIETSRHPRTFVIQPFGDSVLLIPEANELLRHPQHRMLSSSAKIEAIHIVQRLEAYMQKITIDGAQSPPTDQLWSAPFTVTVGKPSSQISLVLPLANSHGGHRLGVNGLAIDVDRSIL